MAFALYGPDQGFGESSERFPFGVGVREGLVLISDGLKVLEKTVYIPLSSSLATSDFGGHLGS